MDRFLLIDTSAIIYSAKFGTQGMGLSYDDKPTAIIFAFLNSLKFLYKKHRPTHTIFALDSECSWRKGIYPKYKYDRAEKQKNLTKAEQEISDVFYNQSKIITNEILPVLGFKNLFFDHGFEGDDVIGIVCKTYPKTRTIIVTRDNDLWMLLDKYHQIWDNYKKSYFAENDFRALYGIHPRRWRKVKRLAGCVGDKVPGIPGVGYKKAVSFMTKEMKKSSVVYDRIMDSKDIIQFTSKLTDVPHPGIKTFHPVRDVLDSDGLDYVAEHYGFSSIEEDMKGWTRTFRMKP